MRPRLEGGERCACPRGTRDFGVDPLRSAAAEPVRDGARDPRPPQGRFALQLVLDPHRGGVHEREREAVGREVCGDGRDAVANVERGIRSLARW